MRRKEFIRKAILGVGVVALFPVAASCWLTPRYFYFNVRSVDYNNEVAITFLRGNKQGDFYLRAMDIEPWNVTEQELDRRLIDFRMMGRNCLPVHKFTVEKYFENKIRQNEYRIKKYLTENF